MEEEEGLNIFNDKKEAEEKEDITKSG